MIEVHATLVDTFASGRWRVMRVTAPGKMPYSTKEGLVEASYAAGDAILVGQADGRNSLHRMPCNVRTAEKAPHGHGR